jgi:hypothetical protein
MLTVLSQPFFRQRQAVQLVTPTYSIHFDRLIMAAGGGEYFSESIMAVPA